LCSGRNNGFSDEKNLGKKGEKMKEKVQKAIEELKPHLQADGGDIELVDVTEDGVVKVRLLGACVGCPMRQMTLTHGVTRFIKKQVPEIKEVQAVEEE
jgi:Fe-S cluster biogenesis protein NfuA